MHVQLCAVHMSVTEMRMTATCNCQADVYSASDQGNLLWRDVSTFLSRNYLQIQAETTVYKLCVNPTKLQVLGSWDSID